VVVIISGNCFGQQTISGQICSIADSLPVPGCLIRVSSHKLITAGSNGAFTIKTIKKRIRLTAEPSFIQRLDTIIYTHAIKALVKLYSSAPIDSVLARFDIAHNRARLFCGGGYAPMAPLPSDGDYEKLYHVKYLMLDCVMPSINELNSYNKVIAEYLDKKYGTVWRQKVRPDVFYVTRRTGY